MKTSILKAYNEYVILANQYRHEKPLQLMKQEEVRQAERMTNQLAEQDMFLSAKASILLQQVHLAHFNLSQALNPEGFIQGANPVVLPRTMQMGGLVIAPRYQQELDTALADELEDVEVPVQDNLIYISYGNSGTPLVYGCDNALFPHYMPYFLKNTSY